MEKVLYDLMDHHCDDDKIREILSDNKDIVQNFLNYVESLKSEYMRIKLQADHTTKKQRDTAFEIEGYVLGQKLKKSIYDKDVLEEFIRKFSKSISNIMDEEVKELEKYSSLEEHYTFLLYTLAGWCIKDYLTE